jgi:hypothetical protein
MFDTLPLNEKPPSKAEEPGELYSKNTVKVYQSALNKLSDETGFTTAEQLLEKKNQKKIVEYIAKMTGNYYKKRVVYSAVFYAIGFRPKKDILTLFKGFEQWKKPDPNINSV